MVHQEQVAWDEPGGSECGLFSSQRCSREQVGMRCCCLPGLHVPLWEGHLDLLAGSFVPTSPTPAALEGGVRGGLTLPLMIGPGVSM